MPAEKEGTSHPPKSFRAGGRQEQGVGRGVEEKGGHQGKTASPWKGLSLCSKGKISTTWGPQPEGATLWGGGSWQLFFLLFPAWHPGRLSPFLP